MNIGYVTPIFQEVLYHFLFVLYMQQGHRFFRVSPTIRTSVQTGTTICAKIPTLTAIRSIFETWESTKFITKVHNQHAL